MHTIVVYAIFGMMCPTAFLLQEDHQQRTNLQEKPNNGRGAPFQPEDAKTTHPSVDLAISSHPRSCAGAFENYYLF
jgi:hypothetical protein